MSLSIKLYFQAVAQFPQPEFGGFRPVKRQIDRLDRLERRMDDGEHLKQRQKHILKKNIIILIKKFFADDLDFE